MAITLRTVKGSTLTFDELDGNFTDLDTRIVALESGTLASLADVASVSPNVGEVLQWNGDEWAPAVGGTSDADTLDGQDGSYYLDWANVTGAPAIPTDINQLSDVSSLLFSGAYNDLTGAPTVPSDINQLTDQGNLLFDGLYSSLTGAPTIPTDINQLTDTGGLLFDGQYSSLDGTPTVPSSIQDLSDVAGDASTSAVSGQVLKWNGFEWAAADDATSGGGGLDATTLNGQPGSYYIDYTNFVNVPNIPSDVNDLTDNSSLLFSGSYNDLTDAPPTVDIANFEFSANTIDTDDSSQIVVVPSVNFQSGIYVDDVVNCADLEIQGTGPFYLRAGNDLILEATNRTQVTSPLNLNNVTTTERNALLATDGDVIYNTSTQSVEVYDGLAWVALGASGGGLTSIVQDTSPQLGGTLDANLNDIDMGTNVITDTKVGQWDTAFGWGDHSTAGYVSAASPTVTNDITMDGAVTRHIFDVQDDGLNTAFTISDSGNNWFPVAEDNPVLYLRRGERYDFAVNATGHPFDIRVSNGGAQYNTGVTGNGTAVGTVSFTVPMSAPSTLYYQCQNHSVMGNTINII